MKIKSVLIVVPPLVRRAAYQNNSKLPDFESYRLVSPVEPTVVAANLIERGFSVKIFDLGTYTEGGDEALAKTIGDFSPDAVVLVQSILTFATSHDWDGKAVFDLARAHHLQVVAILTGTHATNYPGQAVAEGVCDYSIKGEADFAVGDLLSTLNNQGDLTKIPGLAFKNDTKVVDSPDYPSIDLSKLPLPAYHLISQEDRERYDSLPEYGKIRFPEKSRRYRDIMTSRSCTLRCSFCSVAHLRGESQKYRKKPLDYVMREIEGALEDGVEEIHFFDDLFANSEEEAIRFAETLARRNLKFPWFVAQGMPLWPMTHTSLSALRETGMYRIICPFESGNDVVLRRIVGKKLSTGYSHQVIDWSHKLGLEIIGMFVVGMVGETRTDILDTVHFAENHPQIDYSVFSIATPMVGTRLMKQVREKAKGSHVDQLNKVIKRTVALYRTDEFTEVELGLIRAFDWNRINFSTEERQNKYCRMVGITREQLEIVRKYSRDTFYRFFPDYDGPLSFEDYIRQDRLPFLAPKFA